jgi:hypothetical protein
VKTLDKALVVLATVATIVMAYVANTTLLAGVRTGEIAVRYDVPFTPSGWTFAIWSLIHVALIAFTVFQVRRLGDTPRAEALRGPFVFAAAANCCWLVFWAYEALVVTLVVMLLLLGSLVVAYRELRKSPPVSAGEAWCLDRPISLYLGWITAATLANLSVVVVHEGWLPGAVTPEAWSLFAVGLALVIAGFVYWRLADPVYLAVIAWAMMGIAFKPAQLGQVAMAAQAVAALAGIGVVLLLLLGPARRRALAS